MRSRERLHGLLLALSISVAGGLGLAAPAARAEGEAVPFADAIDAFEAADRSSPPPAGATLFVGSSSIRMWTSLERDMAPLVVRNRGFGGSELSHLVHYADRIITPYRWRQIVVYAGDNDLAEGSPKTPERVLADSRKLVRLIHAAQPQAQVHFLSIKPSKQRWARWPLMQRANRMLETWSASDPRLHYIDVASVLLSPEGLPRDDVFLADGLHLNASGYEDWTRVLRPLLVTPLSGPD